MRRNNLLTYVIVIIDLICVSAAYAAGWWLRFKYNVGGIEYPHFITLDVYARVIPLYSLIWLFFLAAMKAYTDIFRKKTVEHVLIILKSSLLGMISVAALSFVLKNTFFSRLGLLYSWIIGVVLITAARLLLVLCRKLCSGNNVFVSNVVLIGEDEILDSVSERLKANPLVRIAGCYGDMDGQRAVETAFASGSKDMFVCYSFNQWHKVRSIIEDCIPAGINVRVVSDFLNMTKGSMSIHMVDNIPVIEFNHGLLIKWHRIMKRAMDIVLSIIIGIIAAAFAGILAVLIRLDSPGPAIFRQVRVGQGGRKFEMFKFRSMRVDAERKRKEFDKENLSTYPLFKMVDDPRITRVGKILRRFYLDELPQLWNVFTGDMSLVGPRPLPDYESDRLTDEQKKRLIVPPGITGLWQVTPQARLSVEEMIRLDMLYIEEWNFLYDFKILFATLRLILTKKGL